MSLKVDNNLLNLRVLTSVEELVILKDWSKRLVQRIGTILNVNGNTFEDI